MINEAPQGQAIDNGHTDGLHSQGNEIGLTAPSTQELIDQGTQVDGASPKKERAQTKAVKYANAKPSIEALENRHSDPLMNRDQAIKNFASRYVQGCFDLYGNEGLDKMIEFVTEAWQAHQKTKLGALAALLEQYKDDPSAMALIQEKTGLAAPKSRAKTA